MSEVPKHDLFVREFFSKKYENLNDMIRSLRPLIDNIYGDKVKNLMGSKPTSSIIRLLRSSYQYDILAYIINCGAKTYKEEIMNKLVSACINRDITKVKSLIEDGYNVNLRTNIYSDTALMYACFVGDFDIVKLLVKNGANVNMANMSNLTPIFYACEANSVKLVEYLIHNGAKTTVGSGYTLLMHACLCENFPVVEYLSNLESVIDKKVNLLSVENRNILNEINFKIHPENLKRDEMTALSFAYFRKEHNIVHFLKRKFANECVAGYNFYHKY